MRSRLDHSIPEWADGCTFFITVCALNRTVNTFCQPEIGRAVLDSIAWRTGNRIWYCDIAVLMPDHVHLVLSFPDDGLMAKAVQDWKSWLAKRHGIRWQENYFDHRLRNLESYGEKAAYVLSNPVRAGLVERPEAWPYLCLPPWYKVT